MAWRSRKHQGVDKKSGKVLIEVSKEFYRPAEVDVLIGNPQKAKEKLGWKPLESKFTHLVELMVETDMVRVEPKSSQQYF